MVDFLEANQLCVRKGVVDSVEIETPSLVGCAVGELGIVRLSALLPASELYET